VAVLAKLEPSQRAGRGLANRPCEPIAAQGGRRFAGRRHALLIQALPPSRSRCASRGPVAQWLEPAAHNGLVGGSSPPGPTTQSARTETFPAGAGHAAVLWAFSKGLRSPRHAGSGNGPFRAECLGAADFCFLWDSGARVMVGRSKKKAPSKRGSSSGGNARRLTPAFRFVCVRGDTPFPGKGRAQLARSGHPSSAARYPRTARMTVRREVHV
jgi:hypothetical protein